MAGGVHIENLRETIRDLQAIGVGLDDIKGAFAEIAGEGARLASGFAPKRSGRLASSIRGNKAKNKAVITAGRGITNRYAGVINYGWARRHIAPAHFMQRADAVIAPHAVQKLDTAITTLIREKGMT